MAHNAARRSESPSRPPAKKYTTASYSRAVARAIGAINQGLVEAGVDVELRVPEWSPHQIRHTFATAVRGRFGLEAAGAALGHSKMSATEIYAEKDEQLALRVAAEVG